MSSLSTRPNGHRWLFYRFGGKRHTIRLGAVSDKDAIAFQQRLDRLIDSLRLGVPLDIETTAWLGKLDLRYHANLVTAGVVTERGPATFAELIARHKQQLINRNRKSSTLTNYGVLYGNLRKFYGDSCRLDSVTIDAADRFRLWLLTEGKARGGALEPSTVTNRCRRARSMFAYAIKNGWLLLNPFRELGQGSEANPERNEYISAELYTRVLDATDDPELRFLLALPRFMGLRCPSEVVPLKWAAMNFDTGILTAKAPKTEQYQPTREIPVFAEIAPIVRAARNANPEGELMFPRNQVTGAAITDKLESLCRKIREPLWPKPFVNLRASCERDLLAAGYAIDAVAAWMGHSPETALKHYNRVAKELQARSAATVLRLNPETQPRSKRRSSESVQKRPGLDACG